ncbi:phosphonopyruvate decarboxylase-like [Haliotis rufescens]|uniref:phosphonopyruvate decarboxylase-like n=1 Tax=Haliotis rufescens TaxID=6454 RepID=UPI00201F0AC3|nr:phosphonopyruvate decarboxylase-like [Haliotis rufescens]
MTRHIFTHPVMRRVCSFALRRMSSDARQMKLSPAFFHQCVTDIGVNFFTGVPDSLLSDYCAYVQVNVPETDHVIAANEGNAVGLAAGYHLATGHPGMVYLQNSGLGNTVNPLMSLTSPKVYSIPLLLLIGWRGQPGVKDEPQHFAQGQITPDMLKLMDIPCRILPRDETAAKMVVQEADQHFKTKKSPFSILVEASTFSEYKQPPLQANFPLLREEALKTVVDALEESDIIVATTGKLSRELFEYRESKGEGHEKEFLTVGSMGHASSIALGIAKHQLDRKVVCLDGDGAALMHLCAMATVGQRAPSNFKHIIFNNGCHDSVGGQPTEASHHETFSLGGIALACGYRKTLIAETAEELVTGTRQLLDTQGPVLMEIKLSVGSRSNLGRPTRTPIENKSDFMKYLGSA